MGKIIFCKITPTSPTRISRPQPNRPYREHTETILLELNRLNILAERKITRTFINNAAIVWALTMRLMTHKYTRWQAAPLTITVQSLYAPHARHTYRVTWIRELDISHVHAARQFNIVSTDAYTVILRFNEHVKPVILRSISDIANAFDAKFAFMFAKKFQYHDALAMHYNLILQSRAAIIRMRNENPNIVVPIVNIQKNIIEHRRIIDIISRFIAADDVYTANIDNAKLVRTYNRAKRIFDEILETQLILDNAPLQSTFGMDDGIKEAHSAISKRIPVFVKVQKYIVAAFNTSSQRVPLLYKSIHVDDFSDLRLDNQTHPFMRTALTKQAIANRVSDSITDTLHRMYTTQCDDEYSQIMEFEAAHKLVDRDRTQYLECIDGQKSTWAHLAIWKLKQPDMVSLPTRAIAIIDEFDALLNDIVTNITRHGL